MDYEIFFTFPLNRITILVIALVLDFILGDPQIGFHPIIIVGRFIKYLEKRLLKDNYTKGMKKTGGLILVLIISILTLVENCALTPPAHLPVAPLPRNNSFSRTTILPYFRRAI